MVSSAASAQVELASSVDDSHTHGWVVYRSASDEVLLVHLPPRDGDPSSTISFEAAEPGELQPIRPLNKMPDAIASIDNRVYLVFPEAYSDGKRIRRVFSGRAVPSPINGAWGFVPAGLLEAQPIITLPGELVDLVATNTELWCLLKDDEQFTLLRLTDSEWIPVELPVQADDAQVVWTLSAVGKQLIAIDATHPEQLKAFAMGEGVSEWESLAWEPISVDADSFEILAGIRGLVVIDRQQDQTDRVRVWSQTGVFTLASGLELPADARFTVLGSVNRLVAIALKPPSQDQESIKQDSPSIKIWEIDLDEGSVVYVGDPVVAVAVSDAEYRFMIGMMILIMIGVLVVVIMPDKGEAMQIPVGFALADPGRRLMATVVDVFVVSLTVGLIFDVRVIEILTLSVIARSDISWLVIPSVLVSGVLVMSTLEWLSGASPGKMLMGIRVVRAKAGPMQRIPFWAAIVRNVIKWMLPPVAALALIDPEGLHRGDRVTRTLVVYPVEHAPTDSKPNSEE